jgi:hypothetical protein
MINVQSLQFKKGISAANFFYMDKFMMIASEKNLLLCKYYIDSDRNDVQRFVFFFF